jgi:hypothetical protein
MPVVRVMISVAHSDLKEIDKRARKAGMSRSAYLISLGLGGDDEGARVVNAIRDLRHELERYGSPSLGLRGANGAGAVFLSPGECRTLLGLLDACDDAEPLIKRDADSIAAALRRVAG